MVTVEDLLSSKAIFNKGRARSTHPISFVTKLQPHGAQVTMTSISTYKYNSFQHMRLIWVRKWSLRNTIASICLLIIQFYPTYQSASHITISLPVPNHCLKGKHEIISCRYICKYANVVDVLNLNYPCGCICRYQPSYSKKWYK